MIGLAAAYHTMDEEDCWSDGTDDPSYLWDCGYLTGNYLAIMKKIDPERKMDGNTVREQAMDLAVHVTHDNPIYHQRVHDWHVHRWNGCTSQKNLA